MASQDQKSGRPGRSRHARPATSRFQAIALMMIGALGLACAPRTTLRLSETSPRERSRHTSIKNNMHVIQTALEAYAVDHYGNYPPYDEDVFDPGNKDGLAPYMPGGDPYGTDGRPVLGALPKNPYSGERYNQLFGAGRQDLLYGEQTLVLESPGAAAESRSSSPDCPYRNLRCPTGRTGTIAVVVYLDPNSDEVTEYGIVGWGLDLEQPIYDRDPNNPEEKLYFVLHN